ncbi:hypothetical protein BH11ACT8_BH11ACT8_31940 [soil metagenome]
MSVRPARRGSTRTLLATAALVAGVLATPAAYADEATDAPITHNDTVRIDGGAGSVANVLRNDTDPNGDDLAICRVSVPDSAPLYADIFDNQLYVSSARNRTGTYEITYYACDFDYLTPGTLTVKVTKVPPVQATKIAGHPGRVKFRNPGTKKVVVLYGNRHEDAPDGQVGVVAHGSRAISTPRRNLFYIAYIRSTGSFAGQGFVRGITQRRHSYARTAPVTLTQRELRLWRSAT